MYCGKGRQCKGVVVFREFLACAFIPSCVRLTWSCTKPSLHRPYTRNLAPLTFCLWAVKRERVFIHSSPSSPASLSHQHRTFIHTVITSCPCCWKRFVPLRGSQEGVGDGASVSMIRTVLAARDDRGFSLLTLLMHAGDGGPPPFLPLTFSC